MSVNGWASQGGSNLGTSRKVPKGADLYAIARNIEKYEMQGLLVVGGWSAYESVLKLMTERNNFPSFNIPMICLPASINNNLPGSELAVGTDTALNNIIEAVDKIKQSAFATGRCFVVEVMGHYCGYLATMAGLASGAERVYLHEEGITIKDLEADVQKLKHGFQAGKRLGLIIRNEEANPVYRTEFIASLFEEEGGEIFDVRQSILGHLQQGGDPSPFDRIMAIRLARSGVDFLIEKANQADPECAFMGLEGGSLKIHNMENFHKMVDLVHQRPKNQWWLEIRPIAQILSQWHPSWQE